LLPIAKWNAADGEDIIELWMGEGEVEAQAEGSQKNQ
jgi:hypothetical protein